MLNLKAPLFCLSITNLFSDKKCNTFIYLPLSSSYFQGVDHALMRAKIWSKYAKDVMNFVEKRTSLEMEWAKNLTRLAQTMRPILKEESYLPFQSIYCTALDQDLEMCATTQVLLTLSTIDQKIPYLL